MFTTKNTKGHKGKEKQEGFSPNTQAPLHLLHFYTAKRHNGGGEGLKPNVAIWYNSRCELMELEDMMYPFMTLDDDTEIVHSEMFEDGKVKVYVEKPVEGGFHSAVCMLPGYEWSEINGLDESEMARCNEVIKSTAHLIMRFAKNGGYANASGF